MNKKRNIIRAAAVSISALMTFGSLGLVTACDKTNENLVIMTESLNGLFNPFYSTSGTDMDVVGMTQISMLSTDNDGSVAYGENEATVVLDYKSEYDSAQDKTTYYFVLKNGIKFSDGEPLTMNDVLFNMYVYLDPVYTGSSTMYSTDIVGLSAYRNQKQSSDGSSSTEDAVTTQANSAAQNRVNELINLFYATGKSSSSSTTYEATEAEMKEAINNYTAFSTDYKNAVSATTLTTEEYQKQLLEDYEFTLETFKEELESDYESAKDSYTEDPYKSTGKFDEIVSFMYMEGFVELKYEQSAGGTIDKSKIKEVNPNYNTTTVTDKTSAIDYVYNSRVTSALDEILRYYSTATTVKTDYISKATEVILHKDLADGELAYPNISGIVSMSHSTNIANVTIGDKTYKVATAHNDDGTVKNDDEYDVLRIQINGVDPKAIWNFGFTVAPYHYYSDTTKYKVDIKNNEFGVEWGSYDFMKNVIQGEYNGIKKNQLPVGAGPYAASDAKGSENPTGAGFYDNNVVYFRANEDFLLGAPKIKYVQYQVMSSTNALDNLASGSVHFVSPQYTKDNMKTINSLSSKGIQSVSTWQLGYGYIGINAGKVTNINLRKAIMSAMDVTLALSYYETGTATTIAWPMSVVSWAYPRATGYTFDASDPTANTDDNNNHDYMSYTNDAKAKEKIQSYMKKAGVSAGDSSLSIKFTIAGSNLTEHPTYAVFEKAAQLLNECGWDITVVPDTNALTKLSTGSLTVWAAAWGSTIDPDMYQVYHKNSTATSVLAWGYREILANKSTYKEENSILNTLSTLIDNGRKTTDQTTRASIYKEAMGYVLDLAVEMPVYQRKTLYAYNANVIDESTFPESINSYSSPLGRIWEIDLVR
jgi:peptide/nickel transport system substrate-binding protein